jgi:uncharacterized phage infection (PIP) family protein YhgE
MRDIHFMGMSLEMLMLVTTLVVGGATAISIGVSTYFKRFRSNSKKLAKRIDALGLDERVTTMVEYRKDRSYVAKVQREDTMDRVARLNIKSFKIRLPLVRIISCTAMLLAIILLFTLVPTPNAASIQEYEDMVAELESIREELHEIIDESETDSAFKTKSKQQIDARIDYIRDSEDYTNVQKIFMAQALRERILTSIVIQQQVYEIRDIIDAAIEEGLSENFGQMLHEIVDRLQERLDVTASDTEKYEDIRQTRKEIEKLIEEELLKMEETIDQMEQDNEDIKEELEKTENETLQDIADKMEQVEEKQDQVDQKQDQVDQAQKELEETQKDENATEQEKQEAQEKLEDAKQELEDAKQELEDAKQELNDAMDQIKDMDREELEETVKDLEQVVENTKDSTMQDVFEDLKDNLKEDLENSTTDEELKENVEQTVEQAKNDLQNTLETQDKMDDLKDALEDYRDATTEQEKQDAMEDIQQAVDNMKENIENSSTEQESKISSRT